MRRIISCLPTRFKAGTNPEKYSTWYDYNSGFGAFLTYEMAQLLQPDRSKQLMEDRYSVNIPSARFLEATGIDAMNVSV